MTRKQERHGKCYSAEYRAWDNMRSRCKNEKDAKYYAGVTVCERWLNSFENFFADVGPKPFPTASIDRIESTGNYEPGNVRWASKTVQVRNTKLHARNTSGVRGVTWNAARKKWVAFICVDYRQTYLGSFDDFSAAVAARAEAQKALWAN